MKKNHFWLILALVGVMAVSSACGKQDNQNGDTGKEPTQQNQTTAQDGEGVSTVTGKIGEIKDFMFVVTDKDGKAYGFSFDQAGEKPEGLSDVVEGDEVTVTYTGEVSEVDPFTGKILSVKKVE